MGATSENAIAAAIRECFDAKHGNVEILGMLSATANMNVFYTEDTLRRGRVD